MTFEKAVGELKQRRAAGEDPILVSDELYGAYRDGLIANFRREFILGLPPPPEWGPNDTPPLMFKDVAIVRLRAAETVYEAF